MITLYLKTISDCTTDKLTQYSPVGSSLSSYQGHQSSALVIQSFAKITFLIENIDQQHDSTQHIILQSLLKIQKRVILFSMKKNVERCSYNKY